MPISFPNKPGIIAYLTAVYPDLATTHDLAAELANENRYTAQY